MLKELASCDKVVGVKQSVRAVREGRAQQVFLACDADPAVTDRVEELCRSLGVAVDDHFTMAQLGQAGAIAVGAAVLTILKA